MRHTYNFIIDRMDGACWQRMKSALKVAPHIQEPTFNQTTSVLSIESEHDPEDSVKLACSVVGVHFRTRLRK